MPSYTRTELLILIGKDPKKDAAVISMGIKRGKLIEGKDGKIDSSKEPNKTTIDKWLSKTKDAPAPLVEIPTSKPTTKKKSLPDLTNVDLEQLPDEQLEYLSTATDLKKMNKNQLDATKRIEEILKLRADTKHRNLQVQKMEGQLIPTDLMKTVMPMMAKAIMVATENELETFITDMAKKYNMSSADIAHYRSKIPDTLNRISNESVNSALKDIHNIVADYSETRGRGEKK